VVASDEQLCCLEKREVLCFWIRIVSGLMGALVNTLDS